MKLISYLASSLAGILLFSSCSSDELVDHIVSSGDGNVSFSLQLPAELTTRAFGDGFKATTLTFAVYETGVTPVRPIIVSQDEYTFTDLHTTINFRLANGKTYDIVFWADAPVEAPVMNPYTFDPDKQTISVNYSGVTTNAENRDAFFAAVRGLKVTGPVNETVKLYRPFAQINLGTTDLDESAVKNAYPNLRSSLETTAYQTLNLLTGEVSDPTGVVYALAAAPTGEVFPKGSEYDYLSMNYLLVESNQSIVDCKYTFYNALDPVYSLTVANVPVQRNYRTNIFGALLTSEADFTIEIVPPFLKPDKDIEVK